MDVQLSIIRIHIMYVDTHLSRYVLELAVYNCTQQ